MRKPFALALLFLLVAAGPAAAVDFRAYADGAAVHHPIWGISVEIPGFAWMKHDLQDGDNFVFAGTSEQGDCQLALSMFAIPVASGTTAGQCREGFTGNPEPLRNDPEVTLHAAEDSPITYTLFDMSMDAAIQKMAPLARPILQEALDSVSLISEVGLTQNQLYGYWSSSETCFELHVSSIQCSSFAERALPILRSVTIPDQPDITLYTVAMARKLDEKPDYWNVHLQLAGLYLHIVEPADTENARRYYTSARRLGADSIPVREQWLIEEGIALAWLKEDDGAQALPHLERSTELVRLHPDALTDHGGESFYNMACARSLTGNQEMACAALKEVLEPQSRKERKKTLAEVKKDPQLKKAAKADCFDEIVALAKKK